MIAADHNTLLFPGRTGGLAALIVLCCINQRERMFRLTGINTFRPYLRYKPLLARRWKQFDQMDILLSVDEWF